MIDIEEAKNEFIRYTQKFDLENSNIKRKQLHSLRVMNISNTIAKELNLSKEEIEIATIIGLLHDIGRFEQYTKYNTFKEIIDHGDLGEEILRKGEYIRKYINNDQYIDIAYIAIRNHNKYKIEEGLDKHQEMFCNIIRDADKVDILYEATEIFYGEKEIEEINKLLISQEIIEKINEKKQINKNELKQKDKIEMLLVILGFVFDINYRQSFEIIYKENYINKIFKRFNFKDEYTKKEMKKIQQLINGYIEEKIK